MKQYYFQIIAHYLVKITCFFPQVGWA